MASQYRYSKPAFHVTLAVAFGLTAMATGLAWMMLTAAGSPNANIWAAVVALLFFAFVSAQAIARFLRDEVVVAILPTGLMDARHGPDTVAWEDIREIVLRRAEDEFALDVHLWKRQGLAGAAPDFTVELASLDAAPGEIVAAIGRHARIRGESGQLHLPQADGG